jgi:hypothetical protein
VADPWLRRWRHLACRKHFQGCPAKLEKSGHKGAAELFDVVAPPLGEITKVTLKSNGYFRQAARPCKSGSQVHDLRLPVKLHQTSGSKAEQRFLLVTGP